jgi:manganese/iron transport system permease protein
VSSCWPSCWRPSTGFFPRAAGETRSLPGTGYGVTDLLAPFAFPFMQQAFLIGFLVAVPAALLSCFLVLKGWSLMGDAVSHAVLPGIVLAYIAGIPLAIGAFAAGMSCALATGYLKENSRLKEDTLLGVVFSGMFGLGIVLFTKVETDAHLDHILFGNMLGVSWAEVAEAGLIALIAGGAIMLKWRDLLLHAFDPQQARAIGLPTRLLHYGLLCTLALTVVGALKATGIILTVALLIAPGAIAFLLTDRFPRMLVIAVLVAVAAALLGAYASFFLDSAPAPTIVLLLTLAFIAAFLKTSSQAQRGRKSG